MTVKHLNPWLLRALNCLFMAAIFYWVFVVVRMIQGLSLIEAMQNWVSAVIFGLAATAIKPKVETLDIVRFLDRFGSSYKN